MRRIRFPKMLFCSDCMIEASTPFPHSSFGGYPVFPVHLTLESITLLTTFGFDISSQPRDVDYQTM
jgi:hypothetical protein